MSAEAPSAPEQEVPGLLRLFRSSLPEQSVLREILRMAGPTDGQECLDVSAKASGVSYYLHRRGGAWHTLLLDRGEAQALAPLVAPERVREFDGHGLPFADKTVDLIVVRDFLEYIYADEPFIAECHRVLKPTGRLLAVVCNRRRFSLVPVVAALLGYTAARTGRVRPGYTESQLFAVLKNGFDVHRVHPFCRVLVSLLDLVAMRAAGRAVPRDPGRLEKERRVRTVLYPLFWLFFQIDLILVLSRGYRMAVLARRRAWRPRRAPVLVDGRSITEAVLSRVGH